MLKDIKRNCKNLKLQKGARMATIEPTDYSIQKTSNNISSLILKSLNKLIKESETRDKIIADKIGRTVYYVRKRLKGEVELSLDDLLQFCIAVKVDPIEWMARLSKNAEVKNENHFHQTRQYEKTTDIYRLSEV